MSRLESPDATSEAISRWRGVSSARVSIVRKAGVSAPHSSARLCARAAAMSADPRDPAVRNAVAACAAEIGSGKLVAERLVRPRRRQQFRTVPLGQRCGVGGSSRRAGPLHFLGDLREARRGTGIAELGGRL